MCTGGYKSSRINPIIDYLDIRQAKCPLQAACGVLADSDYFLCFPEGSLFIAFDYVLVIDALIAALVYLKGGVKYAVVLCYSERSVLSLECKGAP